MTKIGVMLKRTCACAAVLWAAAGMTDPAKDMNADQITRQSRDSTPVDQQIANFERLLRSASGQRVAKSEVIEVRELLSQSRDALAKAKVELATGDSAVAKARMSEALAKFMEASKRLPDEDATSEQALVARYHNLRQGIEVFQQAYERNARRVREAEGASAVMPFDAAAVARTIKEAEQKAGVEDYAVANELLTEAQRQVTDAIRGMMHHRTLVHEVKLDTPEDEYRYELQRFQGYVDLIPIAIEMRAPSEEIAASMRASADKAHWMIEQARGKVGAGDYPVAIRMVLDATDEVRKALRGAGVEM